MNLSLVLLALLFGMPNQSPATTFADVPFSESVQDAPVMARVRVGPKSVDWVTGDDGVRRLYTFYDVEVSEVFKGKIAKKSTQIRELGGEKDGVGLQVSGTAEFAQGEDVVVMLGNENPDHSHDVWGMMMGRYEIQKDADGKEFLVGAGMRPAQFPPPTSHSGGDPAARTKTRWSLEDLRSLISEQESRPGAPPSATSVPASLPSPRPVDPTPRPSTALGEVDGVVSPTSGTGANLGIGIGSLVGLLALVWIWRRRR